MIYKIILIILARSDSQFLSHRISWQANKFEWQSDEELIADFKSADDKLPDYKSVGVRKIFSPRSGRLF
ncbi:hypothetical protein D0T49_10575 [Paludibacter sp. 221]|nr:hypothetical protein [Paludibacter sp. 221]